VFPSIRSPKYNFLQIVLENAEFVGCAIVQQSRHGWIQTFFACNYGHAPVVGSPVYEPGKKAAESCKTGANPKYAHLCAESEVYEKVTPKAGNASSPEIKTRTLGKRDFVMLNGENADGTPPAEGGAPAPAADGAAAAPAAEGGAAAPGEAAATPAVDGAAPGATPGVTPVEGEGSTPAPTAGGTPASESPGGEEAHAEGLLEPMPKPLDRAALEKKFARFLALINLHSAGKGQGFVGARAYSFGSSAVEYAQVRRLILRRWFRVHSAKRKCIRLY